MTTSDLAQRAAFGFLSFTTLGRDAGTQAFLLLLITRILHRRIVVQGKTYGSKPTSNVASLCPVLPPFWDAKSLQ